MRGSPCPGRLLPPWEPLGDVLPVFPAGPGARGEASTLHPVSASGTDGAVLGAQALASAVSGRLEVWVGSEVGGCPWVLPSGPRLVPLTGLGTPHCPQPPSQLGLQGQTGGSSLWAPPPSDKGCRSTAARDCGEGCDVTCPHPKHSRTPHRASTSTGFTSPQPCRP